jgi:hypothetical protein
MAVVSSDNHQGFLKIDHTKGSLKKKFKKLCCINAFRFDYQESRLPIWDDQNFNFLGPDLLEF